MRARARPSRSYRALSAGGVLFEAAEARALLDTLPLVTVRVSDAVAAEWPSDAGRFTLRRTGNIEGSLTVTYTLGGSAGNAEDYTGLANTVVIPAGRRTVDLPIIPIDDLRVEGPEQVVLSISPNPAAYRLDLSNPASATASLFITDNDELPRVTLETPDATATEIGREGARFVVRRSGPTDLPLTVGLRIGGSASPGPDYEALPTSLTIRVGKASAVLHVRPETDERLEGDETVRVTLLPSEKFLLSQTDARAVSTWVFIQDKPLVTLTVADPLGTSHPADEAAFLLTRQGPTESRLRVAYRLEGTALAGVDYKRPASLLTIPRGRSSTLIRIRGLGAGLSEPLKTVRLTLTGLAGYNLDTGSPWTWACEVRLIDDSTPPAE